MQNKGLIRFFAIAFALVCLYQLSFTFFASKVERDAREYARSERFADLSKELAGGEILFEGVLNDSIQRTEERFYLDSMMNVPVFNLGIRNIHFVR
jgi:SecD/SecF fusion protein